MLTIDGSMGHGGDETFYTALALCLATGRAMRLEKIRLQKHHPGLLRQHLIALDAVATVSGGTVQGAQIGATEVTVEPGEIKPGKYNFKLSTARGVTWLLQTLLPALCTASGPSEILFEGGTHSPGAPILEEMTESLLPQLLKMGPEVEIERQRYGFHPAAGGRVVVKISPVADGLTPLHLHERGELLKKRAVALIANLDDAIGRRELDTLSEKMTWSEDELELVKAKGPRGPGNAVYIKLISQNVTEDFGSVGERGVRAEAIAERVASLAREYLAAGVPASHHLTRRLLVLAALAGGGAITTVQPDRQTQSTVELVGQFTDAEVAMANIRGQWQIEI